METNRIPKQLRDLIVKSRNLVAEINQKFTGPGAVITDADLMPLKELFDEGDGDKKTHGTGKSVIVRLSSPADGTTIAI